MHDWIVIGGGPSGLTCATYLPGNVLVLEKRRDVGGCHRVQWDHGDFSEHGPRVYNGGYVNLRELMRHHGVAWDDVFRETQYSPDHIDGKRWYQWMSWRAMLMVTMATLAYMVGLPVRGSVSASLDGWGVTDRRERRLFDTVCRFSDGAGMDTYRLSQFIAGFDYHVVYPFYTPRRTLDQSLWAPITSSLERRGVTIHRGVEVQSLLIRQGRACGVVTAQGRTIESRNVVLALPPKPMATILKATGVWNYHAFAKATAYIPYWSYAVHVRYTSDIEPVLVGDGFQSTPWGLIWIDLGLQNLATRVVSVAITRVDAPTAEGLIARGQSNDVIIAELLRQLPLTPRARASIVRVVPTREGDHAYVNRVGTPHLPMLHPHVKGLAMIGCANGQSAYPFTSIEAAIQNAMIFCGRRPRQPWTVWRVTMASVVMVVAAVAASMLWRRHT
jgi:hypothetical protein